MTRPLPPLLAAEPAPDRSVFINQHAVPFSPQHWLSRLPDAWMFDALAGCTVPPGKRWPRVTRQELFDLGRAVSTPQDAMRFYVAVTAWGAGTQARLVTRRVWVLTRNTDPGWRLLDALHLVREQGAVAAYAALRTGGPLHLKHLGPGFFSKVLYFAVAEPVPVRPLILDQYVAAALNEQADLGWPPGWNWSVSQYEQYLDLAHDWAQQWGTSPDVVERVLFEHGKTL